MARTSWLIPVTIATACSTKAAPPEPRAEDRVPAQRSETRGEANAQESVTPVALAPELLPGWTFRSANQGWWSAAGDEQLFVSHVDLGTLAAGKSAAERADLMAGIYREADRRQGGAPLVVDSDALAKQIGRPAACVIAVSANAHAHIFSCGLAHESGPVLGIEYTSYRDDALDVFNTRARKLVLSIAAVAR